jgi:hypothetical protein
MIVSTLNATYSINLLSAINKCINPKLILKNMKYLFLILCIGIFSCTKNILQTAPVCIQQKIDTFKSEPKGNPPQSVIQYIITKKKYSIFLHNVVINIIMYLMTSVIY